MDWRRGIRYCHNLLAFGRGDNSTIGCRGGRCGLAAGGEESVIGAWPAGYYWAQRRPLWTGGNPLLELDWRDSSTTGERAEVGRSRRGRRTSHKRSNNPNTEWLGIRIHPRE